MEISEFIKETIRQICDGVTLAARDCSEQGVIVNPSVSVGENGDYYIPLKPSSVSMQRRVQKIDFDIAVEATENIQTSGQAGVAICVVTGKGNYSKGKTNSTISHICFSIPICLPTQDCFDE